MLLQLRATSPFSFRSFSKKRNIILNETQMTILESSLGWMAKLSSYVRRFRSSSVSFVLDRFLTTSSATKGKMVFFVNWHIFFRCVSTTDDAARSTFRFTEDFRMYHSKDDKWFLSVADSFSRFACKACISRFRLRMAPLSKRFLTDFVSWLLAWGRRKDKNLGVTLKDWQFFKNCKSSSAFRILVHNFSNFRNSAIDNCPSCTWAKSFIIFPKGRRRHKCVMNFNAK